MADNPRLEEEVALGRRIAELRRKRGMTQEQFAAQLGVSIQYLRRIELAQTTMTVPKLVSLANALDVKLSRLFDTPLSMKVRRGRPRN